MDIEKIRITSSANTMFGHFWEIYNESFPEIERKNLAGIDIAMAKDRFHNELITINGVPSAILSYWLYPAFCYLEYIAITPRLKGNGLGSEILKGLIKEVRQPIILEIEHVVDSTTQRRQNFYQRHGFVANPQHNHLQPPYQRGFEPLPMLLMTYPQQISNEAYQTFNRLLTTEIVEI
jgi:GNAT superfamily N-acetyltransferase